MRQDIDPKRDSVRALNIDGQNFRVPVGKNKIGRQVTRNTYFFRVLSHTHLII